MFLPDPEGFTKLDFGLRFAGFLATLATSCALSTLHFSPLGFNETAGGIIGQALGEYNGGITQSFNSTTFDEIRSAGGFGEVFYHLTDEVRIHAGYGIDDPRDSDLAPIQIRRNQTYYANCIWDLSKVVQLGLQVDYRMTDYTWFLPNAFRDSDALIVATQFRWRF